MKALFVFSLLASNLSLAKGIEVDTLFLKKEAEITGIFKELRSADSDQPRFMANEDLREELKTFLTHPSVMPFEFEEWTSMSKIVSPDGEFRLFNWNIEDDQGIHTHYCFLVKPNSGGKENTVIELLEDKITLPPRPDQTLTAEHWYGALYYNIIPVKKGNKTMYTVLGYNGNDRTTNRKLIDVFYFKGKNLRMGYPLFQENQGSARLVRRVFFEYSEKAIITVRMNDNLGAIVFDHLVPETPNLEGLYDFYIPDMTYDGYKWQDGIWLYKEDIIAYNDENKKIRQYVPDDEGTNSLYRDVNDVWIDPVDPNTANGGVDATAPIENVNAKNNKTRNGNAKHRKFKIFKSRKGPRSAVTGESTKPKKVKN